MARFGTIRLVLLVVAAAGCTSFGAVRSAEVTSGPTGTLQLSVATPPGNDAAWFWSFDCESECDRIIPSYDIAYTHGFGGADRRVPFELSFGLSGSYPYTQGYAQFGLGRFPWGVGLRLGIPANWHEHQLFGRFDVLLSDRTRVLLSPMLFYHTGNSPNGENPGSFLGLVQGIGFELRGERVSIIPAVSLVAGRTERESYGQKVASSSTVFGTASVSLSFHRRRDYGVVFV
jgi:hypothetical protein